METYTLFEFVSKFGDFGAGILKNLKEKGLKTNKDYLDGTLYQTSDWLSVEGKGEFRMVIFYPKGFSQSTVYVERNSK